MLELNVWRFGERRAVLINTRQRDAEVARRAHLGVEVEVGVGVSNIKFYFRLRYTVVSLLGTTTKILGLAISNRVEIKFL